MTRITALEDAAKILSKARQAVVNYNPGAYAFLLRVTAHIERQSVEAFAAEFTEVQ